MDITAGLSILHSENILHRDLKSLNILLDENLRAKITDFSLSKIKKKSSSTTTRTKQSIWTLPWMAPELFKRKTIYTNKSDVYGYGMILWEIASRKIPFEDAENASVMTEWIKEGKLDEIPEECKKSYPEFAKLIQRCWKSNPEERPAIDDAVEKLKLHPIHEEEKPEIENDVRLNSGPAYRLDLETFKSYKKLS